MRPANRRCQFQREGVVGNFVFRAFTDSTCTITEHVETNNQSTIAYTVVSVGSVSPSVPVIPEWSSVTLQAWTNPASVNWPGAWPMASVTAGSGTMGAVGTVTGLASATFYAQTGNSTVAFNCGSSSNSVLVNVVTITSVDWVGVTASDGTSNFGATSLNGGGYRIFPDRNTADGVLHNQVRVRVNLNQTVPTGGSVTVYWRVFDVDDPTQDFIAEGNPADTNDTAAGVYAGGDNRATAGGTAIGITPTSGVIIIQGGTSSGVGGTMTITDRQPGNNWKFVVGFSEEQVNGVTINSAIPNGNDGSLSFLWAGGATVSSNQQSSLLSVWRKLHMEVDSMGAVPFSGAESNTLRGSITAIAPNAAGVTVTITEGTLTDGSTNLPAGNGQFENGTVTVGANLSSLTGNGNDYLRGKGSISVPFTMFGTNTPSVTGEVRQLVAATNTMTLSTNVETASYANGSISIGGVSWTIAGNGSNTVTTTATVRIPFTAHDDDVDAAMPHYPDTGSMTAAFSAAYVIPISNDVGDHNNAVSFKLNLQTLQDRQNAKDWDSATLNSSDFGVAYLGAFQHSTTQDGDPNSEAPPTGGVTHAQLGGSIVYLAPHQEMANPVAEERVTVVHEVSHVFYPSDDPEPTDGNGNLVREAINSIRTKPLPASPP